MRRLFFVVLLLLLVLAAIGVAFLGAFPPAPHQQPVQKVLPNSQLGHGSP
jgi:Na+/proline symporter